MERISEAKSQKVVQQEKPDELNVEPERADTKIKSDERHLVEDGAFISNLGWISILSMTITGLAMTGIGAGL
jgi:hypothetical protein